MNDSKFTESTAIFMALCAGGWTYDVEASAEECQLVVKKDGYAITIQTGETHLWRDDEDWPVKSYKNSDLLALIQKEFEL